jgi:ribosome-binding factor A
MAGTPPPRARQLADRIRIIVAETLESRIKDPRLGFITVTEARLTNDLHDATIFYTVLGDETAQEETAAALRSASGVLRSEVGRRTGVRFTPTLTFVADAVPSNARHIIDLLNTARAHDAEVAKAAAGADYAGESDPYRRDDEPDPDDADDELDAADADEPADRLHAGDSTA